MDDPSDFALELTRRSNVIATLLRECEESLQRELAAEKAMGIFTMATDDLTDLIGKELGLSTTVYLPIRRHLLIKLLWKYRKAKENGFL